MSGDIVTIESYKQFLYSRLLPMVREVLEELLQKNPNGYITFKSFTVRKRLEARGVVVGHRTLHRILVQYCDVVGVKLKNRGAKHYYIYRYPKFSRNISLSRA